MASVFAFDVDDCLESGGQIRVPPTAGPVKWRDLRELARDGNLVGICGNWENVPQAVPDYREFISFLEVSPHPNYAPKHLGLQRIRAAYPGYDHYVMVGNDPGPHEQRPAYWDRLYPDTLPVQHVPGQSLLSNDIGAAAQAGWEFIKEDWFAAGQRTGQVPPSPPYPGDKSARPSMIYKHIQAPEILKTDDKRGIVEAIVSVTGNQDEQNDVMDPGAWVKSIASGKLPRIAIDHVWGARTMLGRTLDAEEWPPGDPRLPEELREKGLGGVWVRGQFNLEKQIAREAYSDLKGGFVTEFSVGFDVARDEKGVRAEDINDGVRHIKSVGPWYEWSPVFMGANPATATLAVKEHQPEADLTIAEHLAVVAGLLKIAQQPNPEQLERILTAFKAVQEGVHALKAMAPDQPAEPTETRDAAHVTEELLKAQALAAVGFAAALVVQKKRASHSMR